MRPLTGEQLKVAIACGGTGGHLFPGLAVADQLLTHGTAVTLMVSPKEVDQLAVKNVSGITIVTLPSVGLTGRRWLGFLIGFVQSYRCARKFFAEQPPDAVLAMGGFTSAPPILAARRYRAATFLHESNTIPGRANRWLSRMVQGAFIGFPGAAARLHTRRISVTGTPVRANFQPREPGMCRRALGLDPDRAVALVMGGSQGAHAINNLIIDSMPLLRQYRQWQWLHLAGTSDVKTVSEAYRRAGLEAKVHPFLAEMELALVAATAAVSRAGASSMAELAALQLPAVLIPFPAAIDNHQFFNARAFEQSGAARLLDQRAARPEVFVASFAQLMCDEECRRNMRRALADWHKPQAAEQIARAILEGVHGRADCGRNRRQSGGEQSGGGSAQQVQSVGSYTGSTVGLPKGCLAG